MKTVFFLLFLFALAAAVPAQDDTRVSATWKVSNYDIAVTMPAADTVRSINVKAKLELKNVSPRPAGTLTLRISPSAEITSITVNGAQVEAAKREEKVGNGSLQQAVVRLPSVAPNATTSVTVDYKLGVKDNSGLASISGAGSQFLPLSFWYPTPNSWFFARGADFAPFRIQVSAPGMAAVSSGEGSASTFNSTLGGQPFFITGDWETVNASGVSVYIPKGAGAEEHQRAEELATVASEARTYFSGLLTPAPNVPLRLVAVKRGGGFAGGGTILFDEAVLRRPKLDSQTVLATADAVAKIWFGGAVPVSGDGGGAIREGLTRFLATQFIENKYGADIANVERLRQRVVYAAVVERDSPINTVSPLDDYYYSVVANKGAMIWRLLARKAGTTEFYAKLKTALSSGSITLADVRAAFPDQKEFLDYAFDQVTDTNLQAGLPQQGNGETKIALRNTGAVDVTVDVEAVLDNGQRLVASSTVRAKSFGEVVFKTPNKVTRVEIDKEKLYPQTDFSDDVAPREFTDSDPLLAVKRSFDKQEFAAAEKTARSVLASYPRFDDVRLLLARSLFALNRTAEAEKEFRAVLDEKLPTPRSIGWALVGLADTAARNGQNAEALKFADQAIRADADYGAGIAARAIRNRIGTAGSPDPSVTAFFGSFDKAAAANQKAGIDALVMPGEAVRFASGVAGQTAQWKTDVLRVDMLDANTALVEANLNVKLLNRDPSSGMAVFRLVRVGGGWKLYNVDVFEVR